jgi:hypothetical protein
MESEAPKTNYITIVRGDSTDALGYNTIPCTVNTTLDLTGATVVFSFLDFKQVFTNVVSGEPFNIVIPWEETKKFPVGVQFASLYVIDEEGRRRTFNNMIPVKVTLCPMPDEGNVEVEFNPIEQIMEGDNFDMYCSDWEFRQQFAFLVKKLGATTTNEVMPQ